MMKILNIGFMLLLACSMGCNDFLKESSQDEVRPSSVQELESVLLGDVYPRSDFLTVDVMTDDIQCNGAKAVYGGNEMHERYLEDWREIYTWVVATATLARVLACGRIIINGLWGATS